MNLRNRIHKVADKALLTAGMRPELDDLGTYTFTPSEVEEFRNKATDGVAAAFFANEGRPVHKWHHYLEIYERYFSNYRDKKFFFLEIGVFDGGSLDMWRRYFGPEATIVGIDINPRCANLVDTPNVVRIGSQADPQFLASIVAEFGQPDVILDDGSHIASHQRASFEILFPHLKERGLYAIEDLHTSYWLDWEGGYRRSGTGIETIKQMIDDMHAWYHKRPTRTPAKDGIGAIHLHDSVVVIEKHSKQRPGMIRGGGVR